jgi:hypothetical protein
VAIAARKIPDCDPVPLYAKLLSRCGDDGLIPQIVWQNLHPLLEQQGTEFLAEVRKYEVANSPGLRSVLPRATERILGGGR